MADDNAHIGFGAQLQKGNGLSPEDYIPIMGVKSITGPEISRDTIDVTDMMSPSGWREFIGGLVNGGEVGFEANWLPRDPTQNQEPDGFMAEFDKTSCDSRGNWRLLAPECEGDPEVYLQFAGIVSGQSIEVPMDDVMGFTGTIKVSGRPELVVTSA